MTLRALCIGINTYPGTAMNLAGCVNDANAWAEELTGRGFEVTRLLDAQATRAAMVEAIERILAASRRDELVVITYSGHGSYVPDLGADEVDGFDEALCPHDVQTGGQALLDDDLHALFAARPFGVRLVMISDTCHSGTVSRGAPADPDAEDGPRARFLPMGNWLPVERLPRGPNGQPLTNLAPSTSVSPFADAMSRRGGDLLLTGCREGQNNFCYDARIQGRAIGAFTHYALKALRGLPPGATYGHWHAAITPAFLPSGSYPQTPQIVGSAQARHHRIFV